MRILAMIVVCCFLSTAATAATETSAATAAQADEATTSKAEKDWSIDFTPYVWVVNINGTIEGGPVDNTFGVGIIQILENLSGLAMADLTLRYKRVGLIADGMWARLKTNQTVPAPVGPNSFNVDLQLDMAFGTGAAFYRFRPTKKLAVDPYIGARWWRVNTQLGIVDNGTPANTSSGGGVITWADPIFGLKVGYDITDKWKVRAVGDVGGGVSKVSWQAMLGGGYQFTDWFALDAVYRVMGVDYRPHDGEKFQLKLNGLVFGFNFHY